MINKLLVILLCLIGIVSCVPESDLNKVAAVKAIFEQKLQIKSETSSCIKGRFAGASRTCIGVLSSGYPCRYYCTEDDCSLTLDLSY
jgi:hypothetical protein